jgi:hypothetical protein
VEGGKGFAVAGIVGIIIFDFFGGFAGAEAMRKSFSVRAIESERFG